MTEFREVRTQAELDKTLGETGIIPICVGSGYFVVRSTTAYGSAQVRAYDSAQVEASDSAQVRAYGSAQVEAYGSAQVQAYGSAQVRAYGSAQVRAYDSAQVNAGKYVAVTVRERYGRKPKVTGGVVIEIPTPSNAQEWCDLKGPEIIDVDGKPAAILFKAVKADFCSAHPTPTGEYVSYAPGSVPVAPDWDGGELECGQGLHFSPHAWATREFAPSGPVKYVACPVWLEDIAIHRDASMPQKCKARGCCAPTWEVTVDGDRVEPAAPEDDRIAA